MPKGLFLVLVGLGIANVALYSYLFSFLQEPELGVHFLSVGQGDAELIRGNRSSILIDAGPGSRVVQEIDKVVPAYDRTIDVAIISHPQLDHMGGMLPVIERYKVRLFVMTGVEATLAEYQKLKETLRARGIPVLYAVKDEKISFGRNELTILFPETLLAGESFPSRKLNETSIVARLDSPAFSALFTGDITSKTESQLNPGPATILKVPHHGSKYSSSGEFVAAVSPKWAVIEVGRNSYGHPTHEALSRLAAVGAKVFRTDVGGSVSFLVDNGVVKIERVE